MGARASMALAIAVVPHGLEPKVEEALYQMLAGALSMLRAAGCALAGGHSSEGAELALGAQLKSPPAWQPLAGGTLSAQGRAAETSPRSLVFSEREACTGLVHGLLLVVVGCPA